MSQTRQLAFRLPHDLIGRIHACEEHMKLSGLNVSRTDVVRLLLTFALNSSECDLAVLLGPSKGEGKRKGRRKDGSYDADLG